MRITRYRNIEQSGYFNPETEAHKKWKELHAMREYYTDHFPPISRAQAYRETISEAFSNVMTLGCYPLIFVSDSGDCFCSDCAKKVFLDERTDVTSDIYYEGPTMYCDECNREIESAYGDPGENESC